MLDEYIKTFISGDLSNRPDTILRRTSPRFFISPPLHIHLSVQRHTLKIIGVNNNAAKRHGARNPSNPRKPMKTPGTSNHGGKNLISSRTSEHFQAREYSNLASLHPPSGVFPLPLAGRPGNRYIPLPPTRQLSPLIRAFVRLHTRTIMWPVLISI